MIREYDTDSHYLRSKEQNEAHRKHIERERYTDSLRGKNYVMCFHEQIIKLTSGLSLNECGAIFKLLPYIKFNSMGVLIRDNKPLKQKDIQQIIGRGKGATVNILKNLERSGIVYSTKNGRSKSYKINNDIHSMGKLRNNNSKFTKLFQSKVKELTSQLTLAETGFLYELLPHVHYETQTICGEPNEVDIENSNLFNREDLSKYLNLDLSTKTEYMTTYRKLNIIMIEKVGANVCYIVHPDLMFRKQHQNKETDLLYKKFIEKSKVVSF